MPTKLQNELDSIFGWSATKSNRKDDARSKALASDLNYFIETVDAEELAATLLMPTPSLESYPLIVMLMNHSGAELFTDVICKKLGQQSAEDLLNSTITLGTKKQHLLTFVAEKAILQGKEADDITPRPYNVRASLRVFAQHHALPELEGDLNQDLHDILRQEPKELTSDLFSPFELNLN